MLKTRPQPPAANAASSTAEASIKVDLISAQHAHAIIDVRCEGSESVWQSTIVSVDMSRKCIVIDEMFPAGFAAWPGQQMKVTLKLANARRVEFATTLLASHTRTGTQRYHLALPAGITYSQRREAFRFRIGAGAGHAEFHVQGRYFCAGAMQDISLGGLRVQLQNRIDLEEGEVLEALRFEFAGQRFHCRGTVKNIGVDIGGDRVIGIGIHDMPRPEERALERKLAQLHRQEARDAAQWIHRPAAIEVTPKQKTPAHGAARGERFSARLAAMSDWR